MSGLEKRPSEPEGPRDQPGQDTLPGGDRGHGSDRDGLSREEAEILDDVGPDKVGTLMRAVATFGPIPPASVLREYPEDVQKKIVEWADSEHHHRHRLEGQAADRAEVRMDRSQKGFLVIGVLGLLLSAGVGIWGSPWAAGIIAVVSIGGPSAATALSRVFGRSERP